jgi:hypothetical protein
VTPGYFETMGIPLLSGRLFAESDDGKAGNVVLVDEELAKKFWLTLTPSARECTRPRAQRIL